MRSSSTMKELNEIKNINATLHVRTEVLLTSIISEMTKEQREKVNGYFIYDDFQVDKIDENGFTIKYQNERLPFDSLTVGEMTSLMTFIIDNKLVNLK